MGPTAEAPEAKPEAQQKPAKKAKAQPKAIILHVIPLVTLVCAKSLRLKINVSTSA